MEIDLDKNGNLKDGLPLKGMNIGFATEALLKDLQKKDVEKARQVKDSREETHFEVIQVVVEKFVEFEYKSLLPNVIKLRKNSRLSWMRMWKWKH